MAVAFDTLKAAQRLRDEAGFSEQQASVLVTTLAEGVGENLATKADIEAGFAAMQAAMQASEERTQAEFRAVRAETQALEERMKAAMREQGQRLMIRLGGMVAGGIAIGLAALGIATAILLGS